MMADHFALLSHLWLHEPNAEEIERAVSELGFPRPSGNNSATELAEAYANLFLLNVFPYGSAFTDHDGELNGESARLAAAAFEEEGFEPDELGEVAAADHLGLCLAFMSTTRDGVRGWAYAELKNDFESWAPVCCLAVEREPGVHPFYRALAEHTRRSVMKQSDWILDCSMEVDFSADGRGPNVGTDSSEYDEVRLSDILRFFLAPARCGMFLSRARLGHLSLQLGGGIRLPFGTRYEVARSLFTAAGESELIEPLLDAIASEIAEWEVSYQSSDSAYPAWGSRANKWLVRTSAASQWLAALRATAVTRG